MDLTNQTVIGQTKINGLTCDSRQVKPGFIFAALPGLHLDGRDFIPNAISRGAVCVLALPGTTLPKDIVNSPKCNPISLLSHSNPRRQFALMASLFYGSQPKTICAVTGTNGKTSVVNFLSQIWTGLGHNSASIGTLGVSTSRIKGSGGMTTPDSVELHRKLRDLSKSGIDHLALEASSHGLHQHRLDGVNVKIAAFTNLTRDHLDYHGSMDNYLASKLRLFTEVVRPNGTAVINKDGEYFDAVETVCRKRGLRVISYGEKNSDVCLKASKIVPSGYHLDISVFGSSFKVGLPLIGNFQISNALAAVAIAIADGKKTETVIAQFEQLKGVSGRLELAGQTPNGALVFIDYAHTPDALSAVLCALRPHTVNKLHLVFGCGGERDLGKRSKMGALANSLADVVIVTDDNPRTEDPSKIRAQVLSRASSSIEIADREEAICESVKGLGEGDILVVAGKGHETGQVVGKETRPFNDMNVARNAIRRLLV